MGQKVNPNGFRLGITTDWSSKWYANRQLFRLQLLQDLVIRKTLQNKLENASVSKILIHREADTCIITITTSRPGIVIGKKGEDIEKLKVEVEKCSLDFQKKHHTHKLINNIKIQIEEIKKPELDATLVAEGIAQQIEKRVMFRKAMKRAITSTMRLGSLGIKVRVSGRLNGAEIARAEWNREGRIPLHTLRAEIDYGTAIAKTTYGIIGIKVWIYRGNKFSMIESKDSNKIN